MNMYMLIRFESNLKRLGVLRVEFAQICHLFYVYTGGVVGSRLFSESDKCQFYNVELVPPTWHKKSMHLTSDFTEVKNQLPPGRPGLGFEWQSPVLQG